MTLDHEQLDRDRLRRAAYWLMIIVALAATTGRLMSAHTEHIKRTKVIDRLGNRVVKPVIVYSPLLSANDRSRWCTIRSLVDEGTYAIDGALGDPRWNTIDMVRHKGRDGREHYYSSKPPLLATLMAAPYWVIQRTTGVRLVDQTGYVVRVTLLLGNLLPLLAYFWLLSDLIERHGTTDWGRLLVMATATFGTFLTTFAITLNNHLPAAICTLAAIHVALPIFQDQQRGWWRFAAAGFFAAMTAANELPALSLLALLGAALLWKAPLRTVVGYGGATAVVAAAFFGTNYLAHQSWRPPYAHRADGEVISIVTPPDSPLEPGPLPPEIADQVANTLDLSADTQLQATEDSQRWILWDEDGHDRYALRVSVTGDLAIHQWDHWYDYDGSYWTRSAKVGVDRGEPSRSMYALHMLVGHHGVFSLTPMWLVAAVGLGLALSQRDHRRRGLALVVLVITLVCLAFYVARPLKDRNYGGVACGFRWLFWLIPAWLVVAIPGADWLTRRSWWGRALGLAALAVSVASAHYAVVNPWVHPWLYEYLVYLGWVEV